MFDKHNTNIEKQGCEWKILIFPEKSIGFFSVAGDFMGSWVKLREAWAIKLLNSLCNQEQQPLSIIKPTDLDNMSMSFPHWSLRFTWKKYSETALAYIKLLEIWKFPEISHPWRNMLQWYLFIYYCCIMKGLLIRSFYGTLQCVRDLKRKIS